MALRDKLISEEGKKSFIVSDSDNYETKDLYAKFEVHGPIKDKYVVTKHNFGELGSTEVLNILDYEDESILFAYIKAKQYAESMLGIGCSYEDRTSFNESAPKKK